MAVSDALTQAITTLREEIARQRHDLRFLSSTTVLAIEQERVDSLTDALDVLTAAAKATP